jgi:hypothetical protein
LFDRVIHGSGDSACADHALKPAHAATPSPRHDKFHAIAYGTGSEALACQPLLHNNGNPGQFPTGMNIDSALADPRFRQAGSAESRTGHATCRI